MLICTGVFFFVFFVMLLLLSLLLSTDCHDEIRISLNWLLHGTMMCDCDDRLNSFSISICSGLCFLKSSVQVYYEQRSAIQRHPQIDSLYQKLLLVT